MPRLRYELVASSMEDAYATWLRRLNAGSGGSTLIDLYELVAQVRGVPAEQLSVQEREALWKRALPEIFPGYEVIPNSGRSDVEPIEIVPYDKRWPAQFDSWRRRLIAVLAPAARRIEHVGSTSVPGLDAKPVIDILITVDGLEEEAYVAPIESLGIQLRSRDDEHRYFRPFSGRPRDVQVHVCAPGARWERRQLLFRDYLTAESSARADYLLAKLAAARRWPLDRIGYAEAKTEVIAHLMDLAERWARTTGWSVEGKRSS